MYIQSAITRLMLFFMSCALTQASCSSSRGVFAQNLFSDGAVFDVDSRMKPVKLQGFLRNPFIMGAKHVEVPGHCTRRVVAFRDSDAEEPGGSERGSGEAVDGELDSEQRFGVFH